MKHCSICAAWTRASKAYSVRPASGRNGFRRCCVARWYATITDAYADFSTIGDAALTNSNEATAEAQLQFAGLRDHFEQVLSADSVRRLKLAVTVYHMAARRLGVEISGVRLVAAHDWDVTGALRAGCAAAFVARSGMVLDPLAAAPDIVGPDLTAAAERILAVER